jgi:malate dehydrogenase (oxaloacetate-decarboxylating)
VPCAAEAVAIVTAIYSGAAALATLGVNCRVAEAIQEPSNQYVSPRSLHVSVDHPADVVESLHTLGLGPDDVDLIVCTDAGAIPGIGNWGVNGTDIAAGKLALYTVGGGIDPRRTIAVSLNVGTRTAYDEFISTFVQTVSRLFPHALLHFEGLRTRKRARHPGQARRGLLRVQRRRTGHRRGRDGGADSAMQVTDIPITEQSVVVFGAGTAGLGIADQIHDAMVSDGATVEQATAWIWPIDEQGLLFDDMADLRDFQKPCAKSRALLGVSTADRLGLLEAIKMAAPTILLGCSAVPSGRPPTRWCFPESVAGSSSPGRAGSLKTCSTPRGKPLPAKPIQPPRAQRCCLVSRTCRRPPWQSLRPSTTPPSRRRGHQ